MNFKKIALAVALASIGFAGTASAATGSITADNAFALYSGDLSGNNLHLIGTGNNWQASYSYSFNLNAGDYLYVAATNWGGPRGLIAAFSTPLGNVYTDASSWVASASRDYSTGTLTSAAIQSATWQSTNELNTYGWGNVIQQPNAQWIWGGNSDTVLFRTASAVVDPASAVPEPETYALMLAGLGVMGAFARRRKQQA